jgi:hypothetical protein
LQIPFGLDASGNQDPKLLLIFGSGASKHIEALTNLEPPKNFSSTANLPLDGWLQRWEGHLSAKSLVSKSGELLL